MADDNSAPLNSAESIIAAIKALPEEERLRLFHHMGGNHPWLLGHMMVSVEVLNLVTEVARSDLEATRKLGQIVEKTANEAHRRGKCVRTKKQKTEARNELIDEAIAGGIDENDDQALFNFVQKQDATLLRKKQSKEQLIGPKNMMIVYRRAREPKNNCNRTE
jgi:hypothetical protein